VLGSKLAHETAGALEERTEGWIAVLRLAALSLRYTSGRAAFIERLGHSTDRNMSSYLVEEVLDQLAPAVQELLVRTSMLEQICTGLCVAILGSDASREQVQASLDWVERSNLFLVPLDDRQGWYRFHPLFQGLLQQRLRARGSTEELATLHQRASAWYAQQGLIEEALQHALAAGDVSGAARLVEGQFLWAFEHDQWVLLEHWLHLLPEEQIQSSPGLLLARTWTLQAHGQVTDFPRLLRAAERLLATSGSGAHVQDDPQRSLLHALIAIEWSQFHYQTGQVQASLQSARSALDWLPPGEEFVAIFAMQYLAGSFQATGREDVALGTLQQALRERSTKLTSTARLLFPQALVYLAAGKLPQLEHTARHLVQVAQEAGMPICHYWAHWYLGMVYYEWNDLDAAVYHFSVVIANQHHAHFWAVQEAMCVLAFTYQAQGLVTQAQETARTMLEWVQEQHNLPQLLTAYVFCGRLALVQDEVEEAGQWLEMAGEQEVRGPMMFFEDPPITRAWMLLAQGDQASVAQGQALLTALLQHVEAMHSTRKTIQVLVLQAWACDLQGRVTEALDVLERALALGRHAGFVRTFADVPKLSRLLLELRKRRKVLQVVDSKMDDYLQHVLEAMNPGAAQASSTEELMRQEGLEPLTERELHILHLLDKDLTNKEIAHELVVTPGTVKVHTTNVYRKLSVNNRHAAVTLAKELGFMAAS
jgi:LuxR family maltose regulon positive regulatory protein